ncbi:MAG: hypothetical protein JNL21_26585 [Myxococcales bacterium]|nr:hypothetical protein [Myxococcales bacterium]
MAFALPTELEVTTGNAGSVGSVVFQFSLGNAPSTKCTYAAAQSGVNYVLSSCDAPVDTVVIADWVRLEDPAGLPSAGRTTVRVVLTEEVDDGDPSTIEVCTASGLKSWTAPPLDPSATTTVRDAWSFLYEGTDPLQTDVDPADIDYLRAALIEGFVLATDGSPLPLATVRVLDHPELGETVTDHNGRYLMVVNGGGRLTIDIAAEGYLPAQRTASPPWQGKWKLDDAVLVAPGTPDGSAELDDSVLQVITDSTVETDDRGSRQLKVLVQPGTTASLEMPNGTTVPLEDSLTLSIAEYTVGEYGPSRMPAALPPSSAYTYAVEIRSEEAEQAGATGVQLDEPLHVYLDNFLSFPVGTVVPVGRYDRVRGIWIPEEDGLVIGVVGIDALDGDAQLDLDGDGQAEADTELDQLGFTFDTRLELASYGAGKTLWHVRLDHLSPCDFNWAIPSGGCSPAECGGGAPDGAPDDPGDCEAAGSRIECSNQVLGERLSLVGTPFDLTYSSARVPGRVRPQRRVALPLTGDAPPGELRAVEAQVHVAGRTFETELVCPSGGCDANETWDFTWDGLDLLGRKVQGTQTAIFRVTYVFDTVFASPAVVAAAAEGVFLSPDYAFARWGNGLARSGGATTFAKISSQWDITLGDFDARSEGLGGFTIDAVHHYDGHTGTLHLGDGRRRKIDSNRLVVRKLDTVASGVVDDVVAEEDGSLLVLTNQPLLYRRDRNGNTTTILSAFPPGTSNTQNMARGPDGSIYLAIPNANRVYRLPPDGPLAPFAGTGAQSSAGDELLATAAGVWSPSAVAVDEGGNVYIAQGTEPRIRRVNPNGRIDTVVSQAPVDGAVTATLGQIRDMEVGSDGALYVLAGIYGAGKILRVDASGQVSSVAGSTGGPPGDGVDATTAFMANPVRFALGADLTFDVAQQLGSSAVLGMPGIRRITSDGFVHTLAGRNFSTQQVLGLGGPAAYAVFGHGSIGNIQSVARSPDGHVISALIAGSQGAGALISVEPELPGLSDDLTQQVSSTDGREVYVFDQVGRHLETRDARFGNVTLSIARDLEGRITALTDENGRVTTVTRDADGSPTAITGPDAHVTNLVVNADGYLETAEDPLGEAYQMTYQPGGTGLLTTWTKRDGYGTEHTWDADGRLVAHENEAGGSTTFSELTPPADPFARRATKVSRTTPMNRITIYERNDDTAARETRKSTHPSGLQATSVRTPGGETTMTLPDGTQVTTRVAADPRFAMMAPYVRYEKTRLPSGMERVIERARTVTLADPGNWFSLVSSQDTTTLCDSFPPAPAPCVGRTWTRSYNAATQTETVVSPMSRVRTTTYDALGRVLQVATPGDHSLAFEYDALGRLLTTRHGPIVGGRTTTREYGTDGLLLELTDPLLQTTTFGRNARGDVTLETRPDLVQTAFGYNGEQQTSSVTPPGKPVHDLVHGPFGSLVTYDPPALPSGPAPTTYTYDLDKKLQSVLLPGPRLVELNYDGAGRVYRTTLGGGTLFHAYNPTTGQLQQLLGPYGVDLSFTYDGRLMTSVAWTGDVFGGIDLEYDTDFRLASERVGGTPVTFDYDLDGLLIQVGALAVGRDPNSGRVVSRTSGLVAETFDYSDYGELASYAATSGGQPALSTSYQRDALGRITQKTETAGGNTDVFGYTYDAGGRLTDVTTNGLASESYTYDDNGNRVTSTNDQGTINATFDDQDRLLTYGPLTFTWTLNGEIQTKTNTTTGDVTSFGYDELGNLVDVQLPNGEKLKYLVDGLGRRVGKKRDGVLEKAWLWRSPLQPVAELDASGNVVARFIYAEGVNVPEQMVTDKGTYRFIKDHLGSVRFVIDEAAGKAVQEIVYDSWGRVLYDSKPGFQPFGFAGGLYDPDTELVRFGARDYDAEVGRWTAKDPLRFHQADGPNLYLYVHGDPVNFRDPRGLYGDDGGGEGGTGGNAPTEDMCDDCDGGRWNWLFDALTRLVGSGFGCTSKEEPGCPSEAQNAYCEGQEIACKSRTHDHACCEAQNASCKACGPYNFEKSGECK